MKYSPVGGVLRCPAGRSGTTGTVTGPGLGPGRAEFDSPVPDARRVVDTRNGSAVGDLGQLRTRLKPGASGMRAPHQPPWAVGAAGSSPGSQPGGGRFETGTAYVGTRGGSSPGRAPAFQAGRRGSSPRRRSAPGPDGPTGRGARLKPGICGFESRSGYHHAEVAQSGQSAVVVRRRPPVRLRSSARTPV